MSDSSSEFEYDDICAVGVDWGTSNLRAWAFDSAGHVVDSRHSQDGILTVENGDFEPVLMAQIGSWLNNRQGIPVIASGMIGSRQGWVEVDYSNCPVSLEQLAGGQGGERSQQIALQCGNTLLFVGGVRFESDSGLPDVMRGEETQIAGLVSADSNSTQTVILPGTHSKWVEVIERKIVRFNTYMTGELFSVLRSHSILAHSVSHGSADSSAAAELSDAFDRGVESAQQTSGRFLNRIFHTRTLSLSGRLSPEQGSDYLSGLLIGSELNEGLDRLLDKDSNLILLGSGELVTRYVRAFELLGQSIEIAPANTTARGLWTQYLSFARR